jgi:hypothetical protein
MFCPELYAKLLSSIGVSDVIQVNECAYSTAAFGARGIRHHQFEFPPGAPSRSVVAAFLRCVNQAAGAVAVHADGAAGRAAVLAALRLMRAHAFAAGEAVAWIRLLRPGALSNSHLDYLASVEAVHNPSQLSPSRPTAAQQLSGSSAQLAVRGRLPRSGSAPGRAPGPMAAATFDGSSVVATAGQRISSPGMDIQMETWAGSACRAGATDHVRLRRSRSWNDIGGGG